MIYELNHVGGQVRDLDASLAFYTDLGAQVVDRLYMPGPHVHRVHIQLGTGLVELLHPEQPAADTTYGFNHIGFLTDDLDADHTRLLAAGYAELTPPRVASSGQGRLSFLADPNGVRVELLQRTEDFRIPPITTGPVRRLAHIALPAPDLDAAITFYGIPTPTTQPPSASARTRSNSTRRGRRRPPRSTTSPSRSPTRTPPPTTQTATG
jgi:catechol 2,3-dioxygenase-like lactoylglutathione lyase family enzyme